MEVKSTIYSMLLLAAALVGHFGVFRLPDYAGPVVVIGLGLAWGYTMRPRREVKQ